MRRRLWPLFARAGGRRDALIRHLVEELGCSRSREAVLRERLDWYQMVVGSTPGPDLRLVKR